MQSVGFLPGGDYSELCSINNSDVAVGACTSGTGAAHAAIWDPTNGLRDLNKMIVNPPAGWNPTVASLIDENGLIAGIGFANTSTTPPSGKEYAFVLNAGTLTTIPNPSGSIYVEGINSSGEVVGSYNGARAFEYTLAGGIHDIGTLGGPYAWATGVNDLGDIVGESVLSDGSDAAFLYTNGGGMVNLSAIVSLPDGFSMGSASGINDRGQIIAQGVSSEDQAAHTFLLTPTPEPSTFVLVITFACFFLILHLCRRRLARS
jgi:probable HAF family extracellular repeat protein